ncbi:hypothetical protein OKW76_14340 [Sphingomonas sp. S1-29]|uniref:hypothetical protein n=1 Tax=Sphingomonas sp. S1-29 TaxID=2991074 RepID=UPI00224075C1|nr:hypothetical protein [Sphingomonas sp. S1-29]UZK69185.1 hypothetical protein OKW76_14340 [Sphingomonas sp. S1-29]
MTFSLGQLIADARRMWRDERALLLPIMGLFYFLPSLALLLLLPQPEQVAEPGTDAASQALIAYTLDNAGAILSANLANLFGAAAVLLLFLDRSRPTAAQALQRALGLLPIFLIATISVWAGVFVGALLILPGLYLIGRCFLVNAVIAGEGGQSPVQAIARSFALTKGRGWMLFTLVAAVFLTGQVGVMVAGSIDRAMIAGSMASPVTVFLFNALAALASTAAALASLLLKVAAYRRLAGASNGI